MVEGDQGSGVIQYFVENFFYTECGHKDLERAYTKQQGNLDYQSFKKTIGHKTVVFLGHMNDNSNFTFPITLT